MSDLPNFQKNAAKPDYPSESGSDPWGMWPAIHHLHVLEIW